MALTTTPHFTIMVLFVGQLAVCPKPRHLKHCLLKVLVGGLGIEVER